MQDDNVSEAESHIKKGTKILIILYEKYFSFFIINIFYFSFGIRLFDPFK